MPPANRKDPKRSTASESQYALFEFIREYGDDDACLEALWRMRSADGEHAHCPHCDRETRFKRYVLRDRKQAWTCTSCSKRLYPTAGTIFHKSSTSLHLWFYAIYLITSTRCGISAKQLERELGVTYKTAWRMFNVIRNELMAQDDDAPMDGPVEVDETFVGGKMRASESKRLRAKGVDTRGPYAKPRQVVMGVVQRKGKVRALHVADSRGQTLQGTVRTHVLPGSLVYTDDHHGYHGLRRDYTHYTIAHTQKVYVSGHVHTQTIEGFFSTVKNGIRGVYHSVSAKWLQGYLNEYAWRYNHRDDPRAMFHTLLQRAASTP